MNYIDRLIENCELAKKAKPTNTFLLESIEQLDGISNAIYVIEQTDSDIKNTFDRFTRFKKNTKTKCAKLNAPSKTMYVGSSTTGVRKRIEQHYGDGHPGTYALHLKHWFEGSCEITVKVYDESREVIQIIEDNISNDLKPAFGKQGGNNR